MTHRDTTRRWHCLKVPALTFVLSAAGCTVSHDMAPELTGRACPSGTPVADESRLITWHGPVEESDLEMLGAWCRGVGPAVIHATPDARFRPWAEGDSLAIISWNIHLSGGDFLELVANELDLSCQSGRATTGDRFSHFVVLLQEAARLSELVPEYSPELKVARRIESDPRPGNGLDVVGVAEECGLSLAYVPSMRNGRQEDVALREDKGNAILSTLSLSNVVAIELPFEAQRKVAVASTAHLTDGDSLRVVSVHLDVSSTLFRTFYTGNSTRLRQGLGLVEALEAIEGAHDTAAAEQPKIGEGTAPVSDHPIASVAAGDFNTWSADETVLKHLREHFPQSPKWFGQTTVVLFPADHLFFRTDSKARFALVEGSYRRIEDRYRSDHYPVVAWFKLSE